MHRIEVVGVGFEDASLAFAVFVLAFYGVCSVADCHTGRLCLSHGTWWKGVKRYS